MPVPRRFDRQPPERDTTRINERIRVPEVRLIDENGQQVGIMKTNEALRYAQSRELDLVEVAPDAKPPVCRVLDYSKYKYEQTQKQKAARKHQQQINIREIKFRPKIAQHDYDTKKGHVERFLKARDKVKVTIMFRGREMAHPERGEMILNRLAEELEELAVVEQRPQQDGRNMTMMLAPQRAGTRGEVAAGRHPPSATTRRRSAASSTSTAGLERPAAAGRSGQRLARDPHRGPWDQAARALAARLPATEDGGPVRGSRSSSTAASRSGAAGRQARLDAQLPLAINFNALTSSRRLRVAAEVDGARRRKPFRVASDAPSVSRRGRCRRVGRRDPDPHAQLAPRPEQGCLRRSGPARLRCAIVAHEHRL